MNTNQDSNGINWPALIARLAEPFSPADVKWRPGSTNKDKTKALALAYAEPRVYEDRLNQICPGNWEVTFEPWGTNRIICQLTIHGITRSSTGEETNTNNNAGTTAEAQAFKRACSKFGLGRYLYDLPLTWMPYNPNTQELKATPPLPTNMPSSSANQDEVIGTERASAMHRELSNTGLPSQQHYSFATAAIGSTLTSVATRNETEAAKVWRTATNIGIRRTAKPRTN